VCKVTVNKIVAATIPASSPPVRVFPRKFSGISHQTPAAEAGVRLAQLSGGARVDSAGLCNQSGALILLLHSSTDWLPGVFCGALRAPRDRYAACAVKRRTAFRAVGMAVQPRGE